MSKRDRQKLLVNEIASIEPSAHWTLGRPPAGEIIVDGRPMPYWTRDGKPITPVTPEESNDVPF